MIGRNDLCHCGSGKKYKKCCLQNDSKIKSTNIKLENAQTIYSNLYHKIYNYSSETKFEKEYEKAREIFYVIDDNSLNEKFEKLFNTYFMFDHIMENKKVMSVSFYEELQGNLNSTEVRVLVDLFNSYISIYEIKEKLVDRVVLKNLLTNEEISTEDINLLKEFSVSDIIIARVVKVEDTNILVDITVKITESIKNVIINDVNNLFEKYKDVYKTIDVFLIHHTHIMYRYIQQLLEPKVTEYLKEKMDLTKENLSNEKSTDKDLDEVCNLLKSNVEDTYVNSCIEFWNDYKKSNSNVKGAENGWAAAVEYHIKKEDNQTVTQAEIAKKYATSTSTLGKRYKDLKI